MTTPYEQLDEETRQEWRANPTTVAFLATVQAFYDQVSRGVLSACEGGGFAQGSGAHEGGILYAYRMVIAIAGRKGRGGGTPE